MARQKKTFPLGALPIIIATIDLIRRVWTAGADQRARVVIDECTGYDYVNKTWDISRAHMLLGGVGSLVIHKGIGGYMGVNKMLGQAGVPIIRL